jgi:nucleotidyltransferase/DNA polymerase involved in DNA repair
MAAISKASSKNLYLHADGDAFFVACELTLQPELRGKPVIVGADRGIAVAMNQEAKKLGVTRGMPVFKIKKLYPEVVILPHTFDLYNEISDKMAQILSSYAYLVERYSIDECFALVTPPEIKYWGSEINFLKELKNEIEKTLGVTYSLGLARTKALSKLASKLEKPGGVVALLSREDEERALKKTSIEDIWGIGRRTIPKLTRFGLKTAYDFVNFKLPNSATTPLKELQKELAGQNVMEVHYNTDPRDQKSIQATGTFRPASTDVKIIWREIAKNAERGGSHARGLRLTSNKIGFFVKTSEFKYHYDEVKLPVFTSDPGIILNAIEPKFPTLLKNRERIRATGVILFNLTREEAVPRDLFGNTEKVLKKREVEDVADKIRAKFGHKALQRAASLKKK